jgi:hypothetical protein
MRMRSRVVARRGTERGRALKTRYKPSKSQILVRTGNLPCIMAIAKNPSKAVAVFCASCLGKQPAYRTAAVCKMTRAPCIPWLNFAAALGAAIAQAEQTLVYGGGTKGLMGVVASEVLSEGGSVVGIVPFAISTAGGEGNGSAPGVENTLKLGSDRVETASPHALP